MQKGFCFRVRDDRPWTDALLFGDGSLVGGWTCFPGARKICCRCSEEISDDKLQTYVDTHDHQLGEASCFSGELVDPTLYHQLIGSLMYLVNTRLDMSFAVNTLSQFMVKPRRLHWIAAKHILRYLAGIVDYGLYYRRLGGVDLVGFTDLDWAGSVSDRKSTSGCLFQVGLGSYDVVQSKAKVSCFEFYKG